MAQVFEKRGGPYTKSEKINRQNEVYRLHFELGYSAVRISQMMKVNRNTINDDIHHWYNALAKEWNGYNIDTWFMKQVRRLESQRSRLFQELEKTTETTVRLSIEKLILDIDTRIANFIAKSINTKEFVKREGLFWVNKWAKDKKMDLQLVDANSIWYTSKKTAAKIEKLLEEDENEIRGKV